MPLVPVSVSSDIVCTRCTDSQIEWASTDVSDLPTNQDLTSDGGTLA